MKAITGNEIRPPQMSEIYGSQTPAAARKLPDPSGTLRKQNQTLEPVLILVHINLPLENGPLSLRSAHITCLPHLKRSQASQANFRVGLFLLRVIFSACSC